MSIAENIKKMRKAKGFTQKQLATKANLAVITIQQYEAGKYNPKIDAINKLSIALDCKVSDLIDEESKKYYRYFDKRSVGENIQRIRILQGLSQKDLAELCRLNEQDIINIESMKIKPSLQTIKTIANALGEYIGNIVEDWSEYPEHKNYDYLSFATPYDSFSKGIIRQADEEEKSLIENYRSLNSNGQKEARKRVQELTELERYTKFEQ